MTGSPVLIFAPLKPPAIIYQFIFGSTLSWNQKGLQYHKTLIWFFFPCGIDFFRNPKNWMLRILFSGCEIGYFGRLCDEKCRFPNYGLRCQLPCNCTEKDCHHINGCGNFSSGAYFWIQNEINLRLCFGLSSYIDQVHLNNANAPEKGKKKQLPVFFKVLTAFTLKLRFIIHLSWKVK